MVAKRIAMNGQIQAIKTRNLNGGEIQIIDDRLQDEKIDLLLKMIQTGKMVVMNESLTIQTEIVIRLKSQEMIGKMTKNHLLLIGIMLIKEQKMNGTMMRNQVETPGIIENKKKIGTVTKTRLETLGIVIKNHLEKGGIVTKNLLELIGIVRKNQLETTRTLTKNLLGMIGATILVVEIVDHPAKTILTNLKRHLLIMTLPIQPLHWLKFQILRQVLLNLR